MTDGHRYVSVLVALVAFSSWPRDASAQVPLGVEFQVNGGISGIFSSAAMAPDGRALVVYQSGATVAARALDASGVPQGVDKIVSQFGVGVFRPRVAAQPAGYIVVWGQPDGGGYGAVGRLLDVSGDAVGLPFRINTHTTSSERLWTRVATDGAGNFVVVWTGPAQAGGSAGVLGRRFAATGAPLAAEFQVTTSTGASEFPPAVAMAADGRFVVAWYGPFAHIEARRYDAQGNALGAEFQVAPGGYLQSYPALAARPDGGFVVAWHDLDEDSGSYDVLARRFDASGAARGAEFRLNETVPSSQRLPSLCADADGNLLAAWESAGQDGDAGGIFARKVGVGGLPLGAEFQVNVVTSGHQFWPAIGCDPDGNALVTWSSFGIRARRYGRFDADGLDVDAKSGNGVFEPGESVEVAPEWRNFMHQGAGAVTGTASAFTGPAGGTYTIADGTANYGPVGAGQTATCELFEDCFAFSVSAPPTRPATHWDASFLETLNIGRTQTWTLHIGASFNDVPVNSPFYRFVETVLHNGVTGGCQGASYCPSAATSREQMPVLVLVAREGATYAPPACQAGSERFGDVPASSPFCRWIEELARRGVVSGCAPNTYCAGSPVSREQMAVFVLATLEAPGYLPPACTSPTMFGDVPASSPFCRWIEELARRDVVGGCANGLYCPSAAVTREQVAVFVAQGFGLSLYGP